MCNAKDEVPISVDEPIKRLRAENAQLRQQIADLEKEPFSSEYSSRIEDLQKKISQNDREQLKILVSKREAMVVIFNQHAKKLEQVLANYNVPSPSNKKLAGNPQSFHPPINPHSSRQEAEQLGEDESEQLNYTL